MKTKLAVAAVIMVLALACTYLAKWNWQKSDTIDQLTIELDDIKKLNEGLEIERQQLRSSTITRNNQIRESIKEATKDANIDDIISSTAIARLCADGMAAPEACAKYSN